jgi:hypothetical protein
VAAEKARNKLWRDQALEAERQAWAAEQSGCRGSVIKELRLLRCVKTNILLGKDWCTLSDDGHKLEWWVDHFKGVVNCDTEISKAVIEALPVVDVIPGEGSDVHNNEELCFPL